MPARGETISHSKCKILAIMKNSGTKPSPTQKREGKAYFESRHEEGKGKIKLNMSQLPQKTVEAKKQREKRSLFIFL